jgi:hypothetical protein
MFAAQVAGDPMQEGQSVTFQPYGLWGDPPWFEKVFAFWLLFVLIFSVVRAGGLVWNLRKRRKAEESGAALPMSCQSFWEICEAKVRAIKNFSHLTLLLALLVLAVDLTNAGEMFYTKKTSGFVAVAGAIADAFSIFSGGLIICVALFCCAMFLERYVLRQRQQLNRKTREAQLPGE